MAHRKRRSENFQRPPFDLLTSTPSIFFYVEITILKVRISLSTQTENSSRTIFPLLLDAENRINHLGRIFEKAAGVASLPSPL